MVAATKNARNARCGVCYTRQFFVQLVSQQNCETSCKKRCQVYHHLTAKAKQTKDGKAVVRYARPRKSREVEKALVAKRGFVSSLLRIDRHIESGKCIDYRSI